MSARSLVKRSVVLTCLYYLLDDWRARRRLARGDLLTSSGSRHATLSLNESLDYIERVFRDYLDYGGLASFYGRVAEIGPGDSFGVALRMLGSGAKEVHTVDRYRPRSDDARQATIYQALAARHGLGHLLAGEESSKVAIRGLTTHWGTPAETFFRSIDIEFDCIVSRAVLEHLHDPIGALDDMAASLAAGGTLIHRIDLRDHGMFAGHHPLTFLTIPDTQYRAITRGAGRPNRVLLPIWRDWLDRSPLAGGLRITRVVGVDREFEPTEWNDIDPATRRTALEAVAAIRPRLAPSLARFADRDLAVSGCVLVAERRSHDNPSNASNRSITRSRS